MLFLQLFYAFFKIGLFGFGGGYAMISMIQGEVVTRHQWLTSTEFTDIIAISQMTPGPIGILGSIITTGAVVLPSFILMVLISRFFLKYQKHPAVAAVFNGLRPGVVGLLAAAALVLMNGENFGTDYLQIIVSTVLFVATFITSYYYKTNPILLIVASGIIGYIIYGQ